MQENGKAKKNSIYHVVINPNVSKETYEQMTREQKKGFLKSLQGCAIELRDNIRAYCKDKAGETGIKKIHFGLEVGNIKKFTHIDGYIELDRYNHLDYASIRGMINEKMADYSEGCHFDCQYVHDNYGDVQRYANKDGVKLI